MFFVGILLQLYCDRTTDNNMDGSDYWMMVHLTIIGSYPISVVCIVLVRGPRPKHRSNHAGPKQRKLFSRLLASGSYLLVMKCIAGSYINQPVMSHPALKVVLSRCRRLSCVSFLLHSSMLILIDRARRDDSNGCHNVNIHSFDLNGEISGCRLDFQTATRFLTPSLAETICQKSSNEAHYTPNR